MYNLSCDEVIRQDAMESVRGVGRITRAALLAVLVVALAALGWRAYAQTAVPVTLWVDGQPHFVATHAATVGALLEQQGLRLSPADAIWPAPETPLTPDTTVTVERARTVTIRADGQTLTIQTRAATPLQILAEAG
ncbi:MAG: ubiquitin-like domain-containing protein, partial [Anaerolineae bacterium]